MLKSSDSTSSELLERDDAEISQRRQLCSVEWPKGRNWPCLTVAQALSGEGRHRLRPIPMETTDDKTRNHAANASAAVRELTLVVAKIAMARAAQAGQTESYSGTKHFRPGEVVYVIDWDPSNAENLFVIGHHRKSRQFVKATVDIELVEHFCMKEIVTPNVIALAGKHASASGRALTKVHAEAMLRELHVRREESP